MKNRADMNISSFVGTSHPPLYTQAFLFLPYDSIVNFSSESYKIHAKGEGELFFTCFIVQLYCVPIDMEIERN